MRFANGASGVISYVTGGNARFPKETLDAAAAAAARGWTTSARPRSGPGAATTRSGPGAARTRASAPSSRGSSRPARAGAAMPIPVESLVATTSATIAVRESLLSGKPERV